MAGDFNRTIYSDSTKKETYYSNNKENDEKLNNEFQIDNSAYGLKLFKGLFFNEAENKDKSVIMYNIPPDIDTFTKYTCTSNINIEQHIDNVLDSFGLQETYEYDKRINASDHCAVLVTLLDATPIYELNDLDLINANSGTSSSGITNPIIKNKSGSLYCYE